MRRPRRQPGRRRATAAWLGVATIVGACLVPGLARAQWPPITDRDYRIDLAGGSVLGSARVIGMGGASVALAEGSAGLIANPAGVAARPATSLERWDWDWHLDWLSPELGSDFDNNGSPTTATDLAQVTTVGVVVQYRAWGVGLTATNESHDTELDAATRANVGFTVGHLAVARAFRGEALTIGGGLRTGSFALDVNGARLITLSGTSLETGALWRPAGRDLRLGGRAALPVLSGDPPPGGCDPTDCGGYMLPGSVVVPWDFSLGGAWRFGPTPWNRKVKARWRDERALIVAGDLVVTGAVEKGHGVEAFARKMLQPSGRHPTVSVRAGAEYEWKPGRLRLRLGSYWEPGRFDDVPGRAHLTGGLEVRLFRFRLFGDLHRVRATLTGDGAAGYGNGGLSVGFWH